MPPHGWEAASSAAAPRGGGGLWLALKHDWDRALVVFLGEPFVREVCFVGGKFKSATPDLLALGYKAQARVSINVARVDTREVQVFEMSTRLCKTLLSLRDKYGLERWAFEILRRGLPGDLRTAYTINPEFQLTSEQRQQFQSLPLHDLAALFATPPTEGAAAPGDLTMPDMLTYNLRSTTELALAHLGRVIHAAEQALVSEYGDLDSSPATELACLEGLRNGTLAVKSLQLVSDQELAGFMVVWDHCARFFGELPGGI